MNRRWLLVVAGLVVVLLVATALGSGPAPSTSSAPESVAPTSIGSGPVAPTDGRSAAPSSVSPASSAIATPIASGLGGSPRPSGTLEPLAVLLGMLPIATERRDGYERSLFIHWIDADGDGCDTRHEVLIRDAVVKPRVGPRCLLTGGSWFSLYDGLTFTDPAKLQIDHLIPLAEAWDSGAYAWSPEEREAFANDLGVPFALLAVSASTNESKSDSDPADWLPPSPAAECTYLGDWLAQKVRWALAVDQREHDVLVVDIRACPSTEMPFLPAGWPAGPGTPPGTPGATGPVGTGAPGSRAGCDPAYPTVCIPAPPPDLDCDDIPFRNFEVLAPDPHRFDGDHDGIGCET